MKPILTALDGGDCSGKSLCSKLLYDTYLTMDENNRADQVVHSRMPGGTPLGAAIRKIFKDPAMKIDPLSERLLMTVDSRAFMLDVVQPVLDQGKILISDRWSPATDFFYGLARDGMTVEILQSLQPFKPAPKLDIFFIIIARLDTLKERMALDPERKKNPCRLEQDLKYFERVHRLYAVAAGLEPIKTAIDQAVYDRARECAKCVIVIRNDNKSPRESALLCRKYINEVEASLV